MSEKDTSKYTAYKNRYQAENYDRIATQVKKGKKDELKMIAERKGFTLNGYIKHLLEQDTGLDL